MELKRSRGKILFLFIGKFSIAYSSPHWLDYSFRSANVFSREGGKFKQEKIPRRCVMSYFAVVGFSRNPGFATMLGLRSFKSKEDFLKWLKSEGKKPGVRVVRRGLTKKKARKIIASGVV